MSRSPRARAVALTALASVAVLASACGAGAAAGGGASGPSTVRSSSPAPSRHGTAVTSDRQAPSDYGRLVLADGDRVRVAARVVSVPHRAVRLCAPVAEGGVGYAPGQEPPPQWCALGVDVHGIDLARLTRSRSKGGAVEGWADVDGVYHAAGGVTVTAQRPYRPGPGHVFGPDEPPCPAPSGGWPTGGRDENLDFGAIEAYTRAHTGAVIMPAELRPSARQVLAYVLTAGDPAPVAAALRPAYGARLCVERSRYTRAQIDAAAAAFGRDMAPARGDDVFSVGSGALARDEQVVVDVALVQVAPETAALTAGLPAGLVRLHPWLYPASVPAALVPPM